MTTRLARWSFVILDDLLIVHAARKLHNKTACGRRFTRYCIPNARTTDCVGCRTAIGLRVEPDPILAVARQVLKHTKRKSHKVGKP